MISDEELQRLTDLEASATPGGWQSKHEPESDLQMPFTVTAHDGEIYVASLEGRGHPEQEQKDAAFIAESRNVFPRKRNVETRRNMGLVDTAVKERSFTFGSSCPGWPHVTCNNCGWRRSPRWRNAQKVFDLSNDHECVGVESYESMMERKYS